jgi:aspartate racemase
MRSEAAMSRAGHLGILGGMGPLASAEFVHTVYRLNLVEPEQAAPVLVLHSDPSIPDRTAAILSGDTRELTKRLIAALEALVAGGAHRIVIPCVTIHHVLPEVPAHLRTRVVSLIDLTVDALRAAQGTYLLLATTGTRQAHIFERHSGWGEVASHVRFLDEGDQFRLHEAIYRFKQNDPLEPFMPWLESLLGKYGTEGLVFGCTELHLFQRQLSHRDREAQAKPLLVIDPLLIAAQRLDRLLDA